jgi:cobalamin-dependent methionine synthase I
MSAFENYIAIGENIHTTRVLLRKGRRIAVEDDQEVILYEAVDGSAQHLVIPESVKSTQDYDEGRVKHVKIALAAAMQGSSAEVENGLAYLRAMAHRQEQAGATFLDINVDEFSLKPSEQKAAMQWLIAAVQEMSNLPLSVDSSDVDVIRVGLEAFTDSSARPMLNSASLERQEALDLALAHNAEVVVTAAGESGMPSSTAERVENASRMIDAAVGKGIALSDIHVDPLVFMKYGPDIHITGGMSNVSFGIPGRRVVNDTFVILAVAAGADGGIIDPVLSSPREIFAMDRESLGYRLAEDMLLGKDEHCKNYIRAWRKGEMKAGSN